MQEQDTSSRAVAKAVIQGPPPAWLTPMLLGAILVASAWILHDMGKVYTELRILQEHVSQTNAVLISKGIKRPDEGPPN